MRLRKTLLYFGKKLLLFLVSVFALSIVVFWISRLAPGDPLVAFYGRVSALVFLITMLAGVFLLVPGLGDMLLPAAASAAESSPSRPHCSITSAPPAYG